MKTTKEEGIERLLNKTLFQEAVQVATTIKVVHANEIEAHYLQIEEEEILLHMELILYDGMKVPIARCKFYFKPEYYTLKYLL